MSELPSEKAPFELIRKIGVGGFGEVWIGRDPVRNEDIAVKFMRLDRGAEQFVGLFKSEFQILSELRHTYLACVYKFGYLPESKQYYFTTELCPGTDLLKAVFGKPTEYVEEILVQILSALDCIHSQGIVHFDIKPDNVLVGEEDGRPHAKLVDFGIAAKLKSLPGGVGGTPAYMAPELLGQDQKLDHRIDLYSLGMLSLVALTNRFPFDETDPEAAMEWHLRGRLDESIWEGRDVPRYLREAVEKLLEKNPSNRFSSARVALNFINLATGKKYLEVEAGLQAQIPAEGPLIERREEVLETLQSRLVSCLYSDAPAPISSVSIISGERGIGKSRLLDELRHFVELKEVAFLELDCDWHLPAWPRIVEWLGLASLAEDDLNSEWQARRWADALIEAAAKRPFCLLIDDFHKAERDMKAVLSELSRRTERERAQGRTVRLFVAAATEEARDDETKLARLTSAGVEQYIRLVLGEIQGKEKLAEILFQYCGGLPLLMVEGLRYLAPRFLRGEPLDQIQPPSQIDQLYQEKLATLREDEKTFLMVLVLLFRPVRSDEVETILGCSSADVIRMAETTLRLGLVVGGHARHYGDRYARYGLSSQALALALIQSIEPETRNGHHKAIALGLKKIAETPIQEIAYHLGKAGEIEEAVACYREAGSKFKSTGQISSASDCLTKALDLCQAGSALWQEITLEVSRLLILAGAYDEAERFLGRIVDQTSPLYNETRALLALKKRNFSVSRAFYEKAMAQLSESDLVKKIQFENALANMDLQEGRADFAEERFRRSLEWEKGLKPEERREVSNNLGLALSLKGDTIGAISFFEERMKLLEGAKKPAEEINLLNGIGYVSLMASRYEEGVYYLKKAMAIEERSGALHTLFSTMGNLLTALHKGGLYAESLPILQKMGEYQRRLGTLRDVAYNLLRQGDVYLTLGMSEGAIDCFRRGEKVAIEAKQPSLSAWFLLMEGYWEMEFGDPQKARQLFLQTEAEAKKINQEDLAGWALYSLADLLCEEGDQDGCRSYLDRISGVVNDNEFDARRDLLRAKAGVIGSTDDELKNHFTGLVENCRKHNFREILWEAYHVWGKSQLGRGRKKEALELLEKGIQALEAIAHALPEEYRDRYLKQHVRKKLYDDWRGLVAQSSAGLGERMKTFFRFGKSRH